MAFANDHSLTTGHQDGTIQVWDLRTGHQINVLEAHEGGVRTIDISPDGLLMASGTLDEDLVRIWDYETNELSDEIHFTSRGVVNVLFSSDSQLLAYSGLEPVIVGWSIEENHGNIYRMPQPLQFGDWIGQSVFTADGEFLIAVTSRGVFAWSVETRMLIELNVPPFEIYHAVFGNEDGSIIALTTDDAVIIYNVMVENDQVELLRRTAFPNGEGSVPVALNPSGTALAYGSQELHLWHIETHEEIDYDQCQE
jgi:WD40 repeat protein